MNAGPTVDAASDPLLHVTGRRLAATAVVIATGEIDFATVDRLAAVIRTEFDSHCQRVVIDLSAVTFMGSVGIAALIDAQRIADESGRSLRIVVGDGRAVVRTLTASGLADHFALHRSFDDAPAD